MAANDPVTAPTIAISKTVGAAVEVQKEGFTILAEGADAIAE